MEGGRVRLPWGVLIVVFLTAAVQGSAYAIDAEKLAELREHALAHVNRDREARGLAPLEPDSALEEAAQRHAEDMLENDYYSHTSLDGSNVRDRFLAAGGSGQLAVAENIARCRNCNGTRTLGTLERLHEGWMNSPGHRANILSQGMDRFGFGVATANAKVYAVQNFAGPGTPPTGSPGASAEPLEPEERQAAALDLLNEKRQETGVPPLKPAPEASAALQEQTPVDDLGTFSVREIASPLRVLPPDQRQSWRSSVLIAGRCGGCGTDITETDVRYFVEQWLDQAENRSALMDPAFTHLGTAFAADGDGTKLGIASLLGE